MKQSIFRKVNFSFALFLVFSMTPEIVYTIWKELKATSRRELLNSHPEYLANRLADLLINRGILPIHSKQDAKDYVLSRIPLSRDLFC